jgi:hypothetical protein
MEPHIHELSNGLVSLLDALHVTCQWPPRAQVGVPR